jgi:hypothetical protein
MLARPKTVTFGRYHGLRARLAGHVPGIPTRARGSASYAQCIVPLRPPILPPTIILSSTKKILAPPMSHPHPTAASTSTSNYQLMINNALDTYKKRTKNDLRAHPLAAQLQTCDSPAAILSVLQHQVRGLEQSRSGDERWTKWLDPTVSVLYAFSSFLGAGASLVCLRIRTCLRSVVSSMWQLFSPSSVIFAGVGVLLSVCILYNFAWAI